MNFCDCLGHEQEELHGRGGDGCHRSIEEYLVEKGNILQFGKSDEFYKPDYHKNHRKSPSGNGPISRTAIRVNTKPVDQGMTVRKARTDARLLEVPHEDQGTPLGGNNQELGLPNLSNSACVFPLSTLLILLYLKGDRGLSLQKLPYHSQLHIHNHSCKATYSHFVQQEE